MEWIKCSDRLPITEKQMIESDVNYSEIDVICFDGELVYFDCFQAGNTIVFWSAFAEGDATHWMPLPEGPKD